MSYDKLVAALRSASTVSTAWEKLMMDAADAIEALQAEQKKTVTQIFGEEQQEWEEYCAGLMSRIRELKAQMPKRGEWIETEEKEWGIYPFKKQTCSVCDCKIDHIFMLACMDYFDDRDTVFHYCPNCGAKMEVRE